jgi:hypothetical protein
MSEKPFEREPAGSIEIANACRGILDDEDCEELSVMDPELGLETAYSWLLQSPSFEGDPEEYLKEKGILE